MLFCLFGEGSEVVVEDGVGGYCEVLVAREVSEGFDVAIEREVKGLEIIPGEAGEQEHS